MTRGTPIGSVIDPETIAAARDELKADILIAQRHPEPDGAVLITIDEARARELVLMLHVAEVGARVGGAVVKRALEYVLGDGKPPRRG